MTKVLQLRLLKLVVVAPSRSSTIGVLEPCCMTSWNPLRVSRPVGTVQLNSMSYPRPRVALAVQAVLSAGSFWVTTALAAGGTSLSTPAGAAGPGGAGASRGARGGGGGEGPGGAVA